MAPVVVAMKGHPGTGKSTLARAIAAALSCPLLDKDDVRDCTLPVDQFLRHPTGGAGGSAAALLNNLSYQVLWRMTETQLQLGLSVVVDSPLSRRAHLDRLLEATGGAAARVVIVECRPGDEAEWRRRLEERGRSAGEWHKPANWGELEALLEGYGGGADYDLGGVPRLVVDTTAAGRRIEDQVSSVIHFLNA
ncbi:unnamed protein product [Spirodela intermedia]|uniref:Uncharacterized protein n=1 Tax=Spirodela intermedia TaxID=51605 RepID=A0A7I8JEN1_SPIIN|nr:unnamed protein product [Spirodela intermedia]CAA6668606.1 unnamed protein product [Spirodela intermedia]